MREIRGMGAVRYAEQEGISFNIDEKYLTEAESKLRGRPATIEDVFNETLVSGFDTTDLLPESENFNAMVERYGDAWIYVPVEGRNPKVEEEVALSLFRQPLRKKLPSSWVDIKDLVTQYQPQLGDTGFARDADLNLLFHAALRLTEQEKLDRTRDKIPLPNGESSSYGRRRFILPPDAEIYLGTLMCGRCRDEHDKVYLILHYECAARLRKALTKVLSRRKAD